jgi:hypothetical protein
MQSVFIVNNICIDGDFHVLCISPMMSIDVSEAGCVRMIIEASYINK